MTLRVHVRQPFEVYCGRLSHVPAGFTGPGHDGCFGNYAPSHTVEAHKPWFHHRLEVEPLYRAKIEALRGKRLACFCALDRPCHVDTIVAWLEASSRSTMDPGYVEDFVRRLQTRRH